MKEIKAYIFDVFGTVVDWRCSIIEEGEQINREKNLEIDWAAFADEWRSMYQPAMQAVRSGERAWTVLDVLHRESLDVLVQKFQLTDWPEQDIEHLNRVWHRLRPWPDSVAGLTHLKKKFVIGTCSNGNVALIVNMAKHSGLPWDMVLGAEVTGYYKPMPQSYLESARLLGLRPDQVCMVAAHNDDLTAAAANGLKTAFVARPTEHGPNQNKDLQADGEYDFVANDFIALATQAL